MTYLKDLVRPLSSLSPSSVQL